MPVTPFPHLLPREALIWVRFIREHGTEWDRFDYDVHVGQGHPIDPAQPDYIKRMIRRLSPKRIDAVGWRERVPTIFEVTESTSRTTIGALMLYRFLFHEEHPELLTPELVAVGSRIDPDLLRFLNAERIRFVPTESIVHVRG